MSECAKCGIKDRAYQGYQSSCPVDAVKIVGDEGGLPIVEADLCKKCASRVASYIAQGVAAFWNDDVGFFASTDFRNLIDGIACEAVDRRLADAKANEEKA